jgi:hypothetical protein
VSDGYGDNDEENGDADERNLNISIVKMDICPEDTRNQLIRNHINPNPDTRSLNPHGSSAKEPDQGQSWDGCHQNGEDRDDDQDRPQSEAYGRHR